MKKLVMKTFTLVALSNFLGACTSAAIQEEKIFQGRIIEYKSSSNGFDTKNFFYEGKNEVVAFDAQFTEDFARESIDHLRKYTDKPIRYLVITHPNPDKFNGAEVFRREGAKVIASEETSKNMPGVHAYKKYYFEEIAKMFPRGSYPKLPKVDETFKDDLKIQLSGGEYIELRELHQEAVSVNQSIAFIPSINSVFVGDMIHHKAHAWLEGGIKDGRASPNLASWSNVLKALTELLPAESIVFGGRGEAAELHIVLPQQIQYLKRANQLVEDYVFQLGERKSELNSDMAGKHYQKITEAFSKEFPEYDLSYMIQYGVYGLVNQKAAK